MTIAAGQPAFAAARINRARFRVICLLAITGCLAPGQGFSRQNGSGAPTSVLKATHTTSPIKLDGKLDEDAWSEAEMAVELVQQSPKPGVDTPYKTKVKVLVTGDRLYFAFECADPDP